MVRYGNVMGSWFGYSFFLKLKQVCLYDPAMTRFNISLKEGVEMVFWSLENALGGELFVPKIPLPYY